MDNRESVAVILPTLNEAAYISKTLDSIYSQSYRNFDLIVCDSQSSDGTQAIAKEYGCDVMEVPRGKLTARDLATRSTSADIIVSVDADTFYPPTWLERTLQAFNDKDVVAVTGPRVFDMVGQSIMKVWNHLAWRLYGSNSAFLKTAYYQTGGFNLNIDQRDSNLMVNEEEVLFKMRLRVVGRIAYQHDNPVVTSTRRFATNQEGYNLQRSEGLRF